MTQFVQKWKISARESMPTYNSWHRMRQRCHNPKSPDYQYYGARGIEVCERWRNNYDAFVEDMGFRSKGMSIERIDNSRGYEPGNCRWATHKEQMRNTRRTKGYSEASEATGINQATIRKRAQRGWDESEWGRPVGFILPLHGTRARYRKQCRCEECVSASRSYAREATRRYRERNH